KLRNLSELPEHVQATISSVKVLKTNLVSGDGAREEVHEVKQWDKTKALELAAKHLRLLEPAGGDTNITIQVSWMSSEPPKPNEVIDVTPTDMSPDDRLK